MEGLPTLARQNMKKRPSPRKDPPHIGRLIQLRRNTSDPASKRMTMKAIWKARKDHRRQVLDWH
eukprot:6294807-Alexandrium_andersonii.AAC.1